MQGYQFIPALAGFHCVATYKDAGGAECIMWTPIIGWRIDTEINSVSPVTLDGINDTFAVAYPSGEVVEQDGGKYYRTVNDWLLEKQYPQNPAPPAA